MSQVSTTEIDLEGLEQKIYRRSHSVNSTIVFKKSVTLLETFLKTRSQGLGDVLKQEPYKLLEEFQNWMEDNNYRSNTQNTTFYYVSRLFKHHGVNINLDAFRENTPRPKKQIFADDALTSETARTILLETRQPALRLLLCLEKDTLARPEEILSLKLGNINLTHDPAYLTIPEYAAKNNIEREAFFTQETKEILISYLQKKHSSKPSDFVFLNNNQRLDPLGDERGFQRTVLIKAQSLNATWRYNRIHSPTLQKIIQPLERRSRRPAFGIHIYSFKKFGFTKIADTINDIAAHAIAGHQEYLITYYKKSREDRAADYRKVASKLQLFTTPSDLEKQQQAVEAEIKSLPPEALAQVLQYLRTTKEADRRS